jgi:hypothetical protein
MTVSIAPSVEVCIPTLLKAIEDDARFKCQLSSSRLEDAFLSITREVLLIWCVQPLKMSNRMDTT